ncbi:hydrolase [Ascochyta rabiei]|uniref:Hydrolase n=1 Tax=Didymella rabiei TaxID=5454 RepID=A0A163J9F4_DIDRA|nr:hydrolase [Ascochyta rabiei]
MHASTLLSLLPLLAVSSAAPMDDVKRAVSASCPSYTIINTRGTGEAQGPSAGFRTMNGRIIAALCGGKIYNTVYPAGVDQYSAAGTQDIINKITSTLASSPNECFILEGYSQGAAATVNAMPRLTGANLNAVKGVFLIGDPAHKAGLTCNVDNNGGTTTRNVNGLSARIGTTIPSNWVSKTLDVCILGDGVCDTTNGQGINAQHLQYPNDTPTQNLGTSYVTKQLGGS